VGLVGGGGDGPAVPVYGAVFEMGDLRRERGVDVQDVVWGEAEAQVAEDGDLVCAAVAGEERVGWVGAAVGGEIVDELLRELEPGGAGVGLGRVLLVGVRGAAGGVDGAGDDAEDCVGHAGAVEGLLAGVVLEVGEGVLGCVVGLVVQGEGDEDDVGLFYGDAAVHPGVF